MITDRCPPPDEAIEFHERSDTTPPPDIGAMLRDQLCVVRVFRRDAIRIEHGMAYLTEDCDAD